MKPPDLTRDTGLAAMLASAQPGDHVVLADWIEEHLQLDDLAAALRQGRDDVLTEEQKKGAGYDGFHYRQLDRHVLLYLSSYRAWQRARRGKQAEQFEGSLLGLCLAPDAPGGPRCWSLYFPKEVKCEALDRLWQSLAKDRPPDVIQRW